ncbi:hypothetical protein F4813DRAFT_401327 [Daldinia decipiens]|uniref:uncharacterized protein n=1 Tax=Daldinia decipiens TaxID=326647 RepID=UPI0020C1DDF0|nr:uncharacterized protein F4813DRAFT_401327 [Daldinia decipiens]KAI1659745.1 hypothetical protein F4813DRAFT_401327 [Daldinia decipiens]
MRPSLFFLSNDKVSREQAARNIYTINSKALEAGQDIDQLEQNSDELEDDDEEDVDDGKPGFAISRPGTIDIWTKRTKLLTEVSKEVRFDDADVIEKYWAREAPEDLVHQTTGPLETPLHVVIKRKEEGLAKLMCEIAPDVAAKAISLQNENGETSRRTSLHFVNNVARRYGMAPEIRPYTKQYTHHSRYIAEVPTCSPENIPNCRRRREAEKELKSSCTRLSRIVESLVQKDPEALATLNALGQSPTEGGGSAIRGKIEKPNPYIKSGATIAHEESRRAKNPKSKTPNIPNKSRSGKLGPKITIRKKAPNVAYIWLHTSGSNAVLWSWPDSSGLRSLPKVTPLSSWHKNSWHQGVS